MAVREIRKVTVQNFSDQPLSVGIEPWADHELLPPAGQMTLEYQEYDEPAEIGFAFDKDGGATVVVFSDIVKVTGPSGEKLFKHPWRNAELDDPFSAEK